MLTALARPQIRRKLVVVGDGACGKTSLLSVFAMGEFPKCAVIHSLFDPESIERRAQGV